MVALPENNLSENTSFDEANPSRRRRYTRSPSGAAFVSLTPVRVKILRYLAELRLLSLPQIAQLCCPSERSEPSEKRTRRHMRALFDAGLVDVLPISRAALPSSGTPNDASLLYGSAPNIYAPTRSGLETLQQADLIENNTIKRLPAYGPRNSLFLAHELAVRDVRVWLEMTARINGYELKCWKDSEAAAIATDQYQSPYSVRPDAWFVLQLPRAVLVGLVEVDRGTERGERNWRKKLVAYEKLFASGRLSAVTGYVNARILIFVPDARRRDQIAGMIQAFSGALSSKFWISEKSVLETASLLLPEWRQQANSPLQPLIASGAAE